MALRHLNFCANFSRRAKPFLRFKTLVMLTRHWRDGRNKIMNKSIVQYYPEKTQILFFDLEFYVPENDREGRLGLKANPYKNGHFLIGGTFLRYFPLLNHEKNNIKKEFWIWN